MVHHGINGFFQDKDLTTHVGGDLFGQVALGHREGDVGDITYLARQVAGHEVDVIGQILPGAGYPRNDGLPTQFPFRTHFARHPGDFRSEGP